MQRKEMTFASERFVTSARNQKWKGHVFSKVPQNASQEEKN
jgi:hypothetical protein